MLALVLVAPNVEDEVEASSCGSNVQLFFIWCCFVKGSLLSECEEAEDDDGCEAEVFAVIDVRNMPVVVLLAFCVDNIFMVEAGVCCHD